MNDGRSLEFHDLSAPLAPARQEQVLALLGHKGTPWIEDIQCRLAGSRPEARDHFFAASCGQQLVAHVWYTVSASDGRLGLLGHVFTRPEFRRRGIAAGLLRRALDCFHDQGGEIMQLFTSTPETVGLYERLGFENLAECRGTFHDRDWYFRFPVESGTAVHRWMAAGECSVQTLTAGDLPAYCLLHNLEHQTVLKNWALGIAGGMDAEYAFIRTLDQLRRGRAVCATLKTSRAMAGVMALVMEDFAVQSHIARCDLYVVPGHVQQVDALWEICRSQAVRRGVETIVALVADSAKVDLYRRLGFQAQTTLRGHVKHGERRLDGQLLEYRLP
jgi:GNAT superfamily N-acetyltransferase